jgi:predicted transcriptional regulator
MARGLSKAGLGKGGLLSATVSRLTQLTCVVRYARCIYFVHTNLEHSLMSKLAVFTLKLESELRDQFMAECEATHRPASQIVRDMMRQFVQAQQESREYDAFLQRKVDASRASIQAGREISNEDLEAEFSAKRAHVDNQE